MNINITKKADHEHEVCLIFLFVLSQLTHDASESSYFDRICIFMLSLISPFV